MILRQGIFVNHLLPILFLSQLKEGFIEMGVSPLPKRKVSQEQSCFSSEQKMLWRARFLHS